MSPRRLPGPLDRMGPETRRRARRALDAFGAPLGSWRSSTDRQVVAVTFDDGPDPDVTPGLLDVLDAHGARSTFFLLIRQAEEYPDLVHEIAGRGHEIALHGVDHRPLTCANAAARPARPPPTTIILGAAINPSPFKKPADRL